MFDLFIVLIPICCGVAIYFLYKVHVLGKSEYKLDQGLLTKTTDTSNEKAYTYIPYVCKPLKPKHKSEKGNAESTRVDHQQQG